MNRRGDIPVTILVIGVLFICGLALFSFYNSNVKVRNSFVGIKLMEDMNSQIEQTLFEGQNPAGLYLEKNITKIIPKWSFNWKEEIIVFSVEYKFAP